MAVAVVGALCLVGATAQIILEQADRTAYPAPAVLVCVEGDRYIHAQMTPGQGNEPVIVLEVRGTLSSSAWAWIQPALAEHATVVSYDRAGTGWSDPADGVNGSAQVVSDLHMMLQKLQLPGSYLLVGHSIGGHYVQQFAAAYPDDVTGLILLDASPASWVTALPADMVEAISGQQASTGLLRAATTLGLTRVCNPLAQSRMGWRNRSGQPSLPPP